MFRKIAKFMLQGTWNFKIFPFFWAVLVKLSKKIHPGNMLNDFSKVFMNGSVVSSMTIYQLSWSHWFPRLPIFGTRFHTLLQDVIIVIKMIKMPSFDLKCINKRCTIFIFFCLCFFQWNFELKKIWMKNSTGFPCIIKL